ncbi:MAG: NAD(P)(+) transhydrogenase (Re/Si-specific) subunit beta, partial [Endomicrobium sp.]|nr:NAD(P)(+) transhydrogenase (Re/Si-specific) subunit beta [Endomicrobium sp.]
MQFISQNIATASWFIYLFSAFLFIQGLRYMNSPRTARKGNFVSIIGMSVACATALFNVFYSGFVNKWAIAALGAGIAVGAIFGFISAKRIKMTAMPQLVSLFNTVGGGAAAIVAINDAIAAQSHAVSALITIILGIIIGCITFTGSLIAAGKLEGIVSGRAVRVPFKKIIDGVCLLGILVSSYMLFSGNYFGQGIWLPVIAITFFSLVLGLTFVFPIGGADMPVVISILNACTGSAVAMAGFVINNLIMIVAGALVGASGAILSQLMAKAMNRSLFNILSGGFGDTGTVSAQDNAGDVVLKETSADDLAVQMSYASKVIIVPGYGLAVAGAQHEIADLTKILEAKGVETLFAIHPVAGRMPGHMNVLLAEANIPYEKMLSLEDVNPLFPSADVALVVGANDVTNPAARREGTPISGMPILDVDKAKNVVVIKRGKGKGYAGIENELYT